MKILSKITLLTSFAYLVGCSGGATDQIDAEDTGNTSEQAEQPAQTGQPAQNNATQSQPAGNAGSNGNVAVNPPHGQPGHDCSIPVGAPLNSAQGSPAGGGAQGTPVQQNSGDVSVPEGMNPPHGQPGHDCSIPVGAPLN